MPISMRITPVGPESWSSAGEGEALFWQAGRAKRAARAAVRIREVLFIVKTVLKRLLR
jgi:hypothetical protein